MSFAIIVGRDQTALEKVCGLLMVEVMHNLQSYHINKHVVYVQAYNLLSVAISLCHQVCHPRITKL